MGVKVNIDELIEKMNPEEKEHFLNFYSNSICYTCKTKADFLYQVLLPLYSPTGNQNKAIYPLCDNCFKDSVRMNTLERGVVEMHMGMFEGNPEEEEIN